MARRYHRGHTKKVRRLVEEVKKAKRVLGWPETVTCQICHAKKVSLVNAVHVLGGDGSGRSYWMCNSHLG